MENNGQFKPKNQLWKARSKHGVERIFNSPVDMWDAACEYFEWIEDNPLIAVELKVTSNGNNAGSDVEKVEVPKMRPFTMIGLALFCDVTDAYFRVFKSDLLANKKAVTEEQKTGFLTVLAKIETTIYNQKYEGAASGFFKENLIARDLGIADKVKTENQNFNYNVEMSKEEILEYSKKLDETL